MIILLSIVIYPTIHKEIQKEKQKGITAMQGKNKADIIAIDWSPYASIVYVGKIHPMFEDGYFQAWSYRYWNRENGTQNCLAINVYSDGHTTTRITKRLHDEYPITNWTIDSPLAYSIAKSDPQIKAFLSKYNDAKLDSFFLAYSNVSKVSTWWIYWHSPGLMDNPHNAHVVIDATDGNILDVETQM